MRLVFPPGLGYVLWFFVFCPMSQALPDIARYSTCLGFVMGYIAYDLMHYAFHHSNPNGFIKEMKTYHMQHHYKQGQIGFGVS